MVETRYINVDRMGITVQLVPAMPRDIIRYGDLLIALEDTGVKIEEIDGIYKVNAFDNAYSLFFLYDDCAEKLKSQQQIKRGSTSLDVMNMTEQI